MARCAGGGIIRSSVATRYQLGFVRQAASVIDPPRASTPHGTCESARNAASSAGRSPAKDAGNFSRSRKRKPSVSGRIGGTGASGGGLAISVVARFGDHRPAVGVADQDDRPILRVDDPAGGFRVALERQGRVWTMRTL
jgi:hypothetical protein